MNHKSVCLVFIFIHTGSDVYIYFFQAGFICPMSFYNVQPRAYSHVQIYIAMQRWINRGDSIRESLSRNTHHSDTTMKIFMMFFIAHFRWEGQQLHFGHGVAKLSDHQRYGSQRQRWHRKQQITNRPQSTAGNCNATLLKHTLLKQLSESICISIAN